MEELDWRWLRSFIAVADAGGTQAAAKRMATSQSTLSRHISQLEEALGITLFERSGGSLQLSPAGMELFDRARDVEASVKAFERQAKGVSTETAGSVRVTMSHAFSYNFAPRWLAALKKDHPHITIEIALDDSEVNLLMREAEIAIRLYKPRQLDLIAHQCGQTKLGFFASRLYLRRRGAPRALEELREHDLIGFDRITTWIDMASRMGFAFDRHDFVFRSDSLELHRRVAAEGLGIVVLPLWLAEDTKLVRVLGEVTMEGGPIYLTAHPDLRRNRRVSQVWQHLLEALSTMLTSSR